MEVRDEDGAVPLHDACAGGGLYYLLLSSCPNDFYIEFFYIILVYLLNNFAGFIEIVQFLINSANNTELVKRMLETVDAEGDTVSTL